MVEPTDEQSDALRDALALLRSIIENDDNAYRAIIANCDHISVIPALAGFVVRLLEIARIPADQFIHRAQRELNTPKDGPR
ncbi:hypothetical protein [Nocardia niwae]|uniref:hypothetical protein n=1 Tax=Nocardia niwae TaxID=626084 RepID=UPI0007A45E50|nr:hypothetical protein [Nocardia niwae]